MLKAHSKELLDTVFHLIFVETLYGFSRHQAPPPRVIEEQEETQKSVGNWPQETVHGVPRWGVPRAARLSYPPRSPPGHSSLQLYPVRARALRMFSQASPDSLAKAVCACFLVESSLCYLSKNKRAPGGSNGSGPETSHPGSRGPSPPANPSVVDTEEAGSSETLAQEDWMGPHVLQKQGCKFVLT